MVASGFNTSPLNPLWSHANIIAIDANLVRATREPRVDAVDKRAPRPTDKFVAPFGTHRLFCTKNGVAEYFSFRVRKAGLAVIAYDDARDCHKTFGPIFARFA